MAHVLSGPDAGLRVALGAGLSFIGRDPAAHVQLSDDLVSRRHASVHVGAQIVLTDLNSANGVEVDGSAVDGALLTDGSEVRVGDTVLRIEGIDAVSALDPDRSTVDFSRSPRVSTQWVGEALPAPELPRVGERPRLPWIALVAPVIAGVGLFALTQNPLMLLFVALSPVMMLGSWIDQRVRHRRQRSEERRRFEEGLESLRADLATRQDAERAGRLAEAPAIADVVAAVRTRSNVLWMRLPEHASFMSLRLGTGTLPSRTTVQLPGRMLDAAEDWDRLNETVQSYRAVDGVPVVDRLSDAGAIGVAGSELFASDVARALMLQVAGLHSPAQVAIAAFAPADTASEWEWLKWLPHVDSPHHPLSASLADDIPASGKMLAELEGLVASRRAAMGLGATVRSHLDAESPAAAGLWQPVDRQVATPAVVVFVAGEPAADRGRLVQVAQDGPDVGVYTIWLADDVSRLPVVCRTFIEARSATGTAFFVRHGTTVQLASLELATAMTTSESARLLAPLVDDGAPVLDESDLPRSVAFVELYDDDVAGDPDAVASRWARSDSLVSSWATGARREPGGLGGLVGHGVDGPLRIDLRRDGPHALVGGTTGSGKSELLQTWLLGMAVENSPERLTFLLVDYKGGSAFGDAVTLPHTVGLVTDLTPHLVSSAVNSLQ
ncbi:FHA domain-containing protein [Microbacterium lacticum]|nr:FHA domain-containing protein [Microbacterium lacticum]